MTFDMKSYQREYREKNKENKRKYQREWARKQSKNPEFRKRRNDAIRKYYLANPEILSKQKQLRSEQKITDKRLNSIGWIDDKGYRRILIKGEKGFYDITEHKYIMQKTIGRIISSEEHIHHKNGNKLDNRIENLELMSKKEHGSLEGKKGKGIPRPSLRKEPPKKNCLFCEKEFIILHSQFQRRFCSKSCASKDRHKKMMICKDAKKEIEQEGKL